MPKNRDTWVSPVPVKVALSRVTVGEDLRTAVDTVVRRYRARRMNRSRSILNHWGEGTATDTSRPDIDLHQQVIASPLTALVFETAKSVPLRLTGSSFRMILSNRVKRSDSSDRTVPPFRSECVLDYRWWMNHGA